MEMERVDEILVRRMYKKARLWTCRDYREKKGGIYE
jgi:hypothetical protein